MPCDRLDQVVCRLEAVASKLESISCGKGGDDASEFVNSFEELIKTHISKFVEASNKIGGDVAEAGKLVQKGFQETLAILVTASKCKKPAQNQMNEVLKPLSAHVENVKNYCSKNFKSEFKAHLDALSSASVSFGWVSQPMKPHNFVNETIDSSMFYTNRVLTGFKDKGPQHKEWVQSFNECFKALSAYVQEWHATGLTWNPKGTDVPSSTAAASHQHNVKDASAGEKKPVAAGEKKPAAASGESPSAAALFSSINKGTGITSGLKKVDDSMKTHKNPNLRAGCTVSEKESSPQTSAAAGKVAGTSSAASKPPVFEVQGKKWVIENQRNQDMMLIDQGDISYTASIWNCVNSNFKVTQKINAISFEGCKNCKVQISEGLISSCDVINSLKIEIHADCQLPFVTINNTDGCQVYLNQKSKDTSVSTSRSCGVNVCLWAEDGELAEHPVPYQFVSSFKNGKLVTEVAENV